MKKEMELDIYVYHHSQSQVEANILYRHLDWGVSIGRDCTCVNQQRALGVTVLGRDGERMAL